MARQTGAKLQVGRATINSAPSEEMSDPTEIPEDEILPEYCLNSGVRGKHAARYAAGTKLERLEADVIAESPDSRPVNNALRGRLTLVIACAAALLCGACLPIAHTRTVSPAIEGTYRNEDGTPVAGVPLALSITFNDSTCASPSLRTTTDAAGRFTFPATRQRERYVLLLPYDALYAYTICGGEPATSTLYTTNYMHRVPASVFVTCTWLAVPEPSGRRAYCTSSRRPRRRRARR